MPDKIKVYVGFTYTHSPQTFRDKVKTLKDRLTQEGYEVIEPDNTVVNTHERDISLTIGACDVFVAVCDYYATSVGIQIGAAIWKYGKPTIVVASKSSSISPLLWDIPPFVSHYNFHRYHELVPETLLILRKTVEVITR